MPPDPNREKEIFQAALARQSPGERAAFLEGVCGTDAELLDRVRALLREYEASTGLLAQPIAARRGTIPETPEELAAKSKPKERFGEQDLKGQEIAGRYKLLQRLGEGGMGEVWMAEQSEPVRRMVALKIIKAGMDSSHVLARFEAERQALAMMDHSNIAKVLDGGITESGRPFFVMELVKGIPCTRYCDQEKLTPRERLELFIPVCHAVQHAHQKGIIHRDLKPSNILIALYDGKPVPKVIDFGVAKATQQRLTERTLFTEVGQFVGTPTYMPPEQAELNNLDIDTRADIYALGVVLYELLSGTTPFTTKQLLDAGFAEMLRIIREVEPSKPSTKLSSSESLPSIAANRKLEPHRLTKMVSGDLDWIVMKCLEKERSRRYDSANGLAQDIQRFLTDEPVLAGPPSTRYRLRKLLKRNRGAVSAGLLTLLAILAGSFGIYLNYRDAKEQERIAKANEDKANSALGEKEIALGEKTKAFKRADDDRNDLNYRLALDNILLAKAAFDARNVSMANEKLDQVPPHLRRWEWYYLRRQFAGGIYTLYGFPGFNKNRNVMFSPDGTQIIAPFDANAMRVFDARTGTVRFDLRGHLGSVVCASYSPDGTCIVTASSDTTAKVWSAKTGAMLLDLKGHTANVEFAQFSPNNSRIITASRDRTARVWDARTGATQFELKGHTEVVNSASFSPDGTRIVTGSSDLTAKIWDGTTGAHLFDLQGHTSPLGIARFAPDGTRILTACETENIAKVWNAHTGAHQFDLSGHSHWIRDACFSSDGRIIVTGSVDTTAKIWDTKTGAWMFDLRGHTAEVLTVTLSPDGNRVLTGSKDGTAIVWHAKTGARLLDLRRHRYDVKSASFSPDGARIVTASQDFSLTIWDARTGTPQVVLAGHQSDVNYAAFLRDGRRIVTHSNDLTARIWDARTGLVLHEFRSPDVLSVYPSPDGKRIATGHRDGALSVWNANTGRFLFGLKSPGGIRHASFSPDGTRIVTGSNRSDARVWDSATGKLVLELKGHTPATSFATYSPDGTRIITAAGKTATLWDANTGALLFDLVGNTDEITKASINSDDTRIVTESGNRVKIWEGKSGLFLFDLIAAHSRESNATFSPNGRRIVTQSIINSARIWDARSGKLLVELRGHSGWITSTSFSPDSSRVVTGSWDKSARIWDVQTGAPLLELRGHDEQVTSVAFSADGSGIVTASSDRVAKVWDATARNLDLAPLDLDKYSGSVEIFFSPIDKRVLTKDQQITEVWDARTGQVLPDDPIPVELMPVRPGLISRYFAQQQGNSFRIVDLWLSPEEFEYRAFWTSPRPDWHREEFDKALRAKDRFAAHFHVDCMLMHQPGDHLPLLRQRLELVQHDLPLVARISGHSPALAKPSLGAIFILSTRWDPISMRLLGGLLIRAHKPSEAIGPLKFALAFRAKDGPPVEELLLALACFGAKQREAAANWHSQAVAYLDRYRSPIQVLLGGFWSGSVQVRKFQLDPRYNSIDWETWYECDVFRAEVEAKLK